MSGDDASAGATSSATVPSGETLPPIERAFVYEPKAGDVLVIETDDHCTQDQAARIRQVIEAHFGPNVSCLVLSAARLGGVIRGRS